MNSPEDEAEVQFDNRAIGRTIRSLRRKKGISQDVLSGLAGIARTHLTMIENGDKQANFEHYGNSQMHWICAPASLRPLLSMKLSNAATVGNT